MDVVFGKTHCEVGLQHLDYGHIIGGACIPPSKILKIMETVRSVGGELIDRTSKKKGIAKKSIIFLKWQQLEYGKSFYAQQTIPSETFSYIKYLNRKFRLHHYFLPVGNTSVRADTFMNDETLGRTVLYSNSLIVNVDPMTRRPEPFLKCLKEHFSVDNCETPNLNFDKMSPKCTERYKKPKSAIFHTFSSRISVSFLDANNHSNAACYADLCYDCLGDAINKKVFDSLSGSIFDHKIRRVSLLYLNECRMGDIVDTVIWQNKNNKEEFRFHVLKDGDLICQAEIELFPMLLEAKL